MDKQMNEQERFLKEKEEFNKTSSNTEEQNDIQKVEKLEVLDI